MPPRKKEQHDEDNFAIVNINDNEPQPIGVDICNKLLAHKQITSVLNYLIKNDETAKNSQPIHIEKIYQILPNTMQKLTINHWFLIYILSAYPFRIEYAKDDAKQTKIEKENGRIVARYNYYPMPIYHYLNDEYCYFLKQSKNVLKKCGWVLKDEMLGKEHCLIFLVAVFSVIKHIQYNTMENEQINLNLLRNMKTWLISIIGENSQASKQMMVKKFSEFFNLMLNHKERDAKVADIKCLFVITNDEESSYDFIQVKRPTNAPISIDTLVKIQLSIFDSRLEHKYGCWYEATFIGHLQNGSRSKQHNNYSQYGWYRSFLISHTLQLVAKVLTILENQELEPNNYDETIFNQCLNEQAFLNEEKQKPLVQHMIKVGHFGLDENVSNLEKQHWQYWCEQALILFSEE